MLQGFVRVGDVSGVGGREVQRRVNTFWKQVDSGHFPNPKSNPREVVSRAQGVVEVCGVPGLRFRPRSCLQVQCLQSSASTLNPETPNGLGFRV